MTALSVSPHDGRRVLVSGDMLGMGLSQDGGASWEPTFGLPAYEMADVTWHPTDPEVVWAASMSGPCVSLDGGVNWRWQRDGMGPGERSRFSSPIENILFDPNNADRLIAVGGSSRDWGQGQHQSSMGRVWESTDAGQTWEAISALTSVGSIARSSGGTGVNIVAAAFGGGSSDILYAAAMGEGVFVSRDGGKTWTSQNDGLLHTNAIRLQAHPNDPSTAWVSLWSSAEKGEDGKYLPGGIYKTTDYGATWQAINNGLPQKYGDHWRANTSIYIGFAVAPSNPDYMVTFDGSYEQGVSYVTRNGGESWHPTATRTNNGDTAHVAQLNKRTKDSHSIQLLDHEIAYYAGMGLEFVTFDPKDENRIYACGSEYILYSEDGGYTWEDVSSDMIGETDYGLAYRSRGYGGLVASDFAFDPNTPGVAVAQGLDAARVWMSRDDLQSWTYHAADERPWDGGYGIAFGTNGHIYTGIGQHGFRGFARSLDDGKTWDVFHGSAHGLPERSVKGEMKVTDIVVHPQSPKRLWMVAGGQLLGSTDAGTQWETNAALADLGYAEADPIHPGSFYISSKKGVYYGDGTDFTLIPGPKNTGRVAVDASGRLYVAAGERTGGDLGLWRYDARTEEWTLLFDSPVVMDVAIDPFNPKRMVLTTGDVPAWDINRGNGVWASDDGGESWAMSNDGLAMRRGVVVVCDPHQQGRVVLGTRGRGFFVGHWPQGSMPEGERHRAAPRPLSWSNDTKLTTATPPSAIHLASINDTQDTVANGDMSEADNGQLLHWSVTWQADGVVNATQDSSIFRSEPASMRVDTSAAETKCLVGQWINVLPAGSRITGSVKSQGPVKVSVTVRSVDVNNAVLAKQQIQYLGADNNWTDFDKAVDLAEAGDRYFIGIYAEGQGSVWLDDIAITSDAVVEEPE
ncbi:MAG: hypothetical protein AAF086_08405 [Planctomycetota bacterium]